MDNYNLTEAQLKEGCKKCIENVQNLLDSAMLLLNNENSHQYALGLYVYAFEEFGKAQILKNYLTKNEYSLPDWIFGEGKDARKAHFRKLSEAFKKLPPVCWELSNTIKIKITDNSSDIPQTIIIMKDNVPIGSVSIPSNTSGVFEDASIPKPNFLDLKTICFYIDWDNTNNNWKFVIPADKDQLTQNIKCMKEAVDKFDEYT